MNAKAWSTLLLSVLALLVGCGGASAPPKPPTAQVADAPEGSDEAESAEGSTLGTAVGGDALVPVTDQDARWGSETAPVTLVMFTDLQCPFCGRAAVTIDALRREYGADRLRVVYKHNPLPFHKDAQPAALVAQAIFELAGFDAFLAFTHRAYENRGELSDQNLVQWAREVGVQRADLRLQLASAKRKVEADKALANDRGAQGTPTFFINGVFVSGAQPIDKFRAVIDDQLERARGLTDRGVPAERLYVELVRRQGAKAEPSSRKPPPPPDTTVWKVPVGKSPVIGAKDAPVTIVVFADLQCPFCRRAHATLEELLKRYPDKIRIVFKHNPLPFHPQAIPAALVSEEAYKRGKSKLFWEAVELLYDRQPNNLDEAGLLEVAKSLKLNLHRVKQVLKEDPKTQKPKASKTIIDDQDLASSLNARGTPHFFINGRRLPGAQPIEKFQALIDERLASAEELMRTKKLRPGQVYAAIMKTAKEEDAPETKKLPAVSTANPSRGPRNAPVVVRMFSDFQCPFCSRVEPTLEQLEKQFPGKIRIVWHNLPLPFHKDAPLAAAAALEARAQQGDRGFWAMHELLFANQRALDMASLEGYAQQIGLKLDRFRDALGTGKHKAAIDKDLAMARAAGISGTPGFVINGYFVSGAQPFPAFAKVVRRALEDRRKGRKP